MPFAIKGDRSDIVGMLVEYKNLEPMKKEISLGLN